MKSAAVLPAVREVQPAGSGGVVESTQTGPRAKCHATQSPKLLPIGNLQRDASSVTILEGHCHLTRRKFRSEQQGIGRVDLPTRDLMVGETDSQTAGL